MCASEVKILSHELPMLRRSCPTAGGKAGAAQEKQVTATRFVTPHDLDTRRLCSNKIAFIRSLILQGRRSLCGYVAATGAAFYSIITATATVSGPRSLDEEHGIFFHSHI